MPLKQTAASHRYINASSECWDLYTEVLAIEYGDALLFQQVHQLTVDCYTSQHPGGEHPDKSIGIHLCGLHLALDLNVPSSSIPPLRQRLAESVESWPHFSPPADLGPLTVFDVALADSADDHAAKVQQWARSVWEAWAPRHDAVAVLVQRYLRGAPSSLHG